MLTTARKKGDAEAAAQSVVNYVVIWSQEWKLNLRADTSEVNPFSISSNDSTWTPNIFNDTQKVCVNTTPLLLGVILDRSLTFNFLYVEVGLLGQLPKIATSKYKKSFTGSASVQL